MVINMRGMYMSVGHLDELQSPHNSFYIYVCSDWNDAYDNGCDIGALQLKSSRSSLKPLRMTS